jgi:prepilin-type N-terminal cleavage/methylation domain-containing protein
MTTKQKGFTLTELLIVVSIIVVLGLAILVGINPLSQIFKGYDARRKSDLSRIKIAMEAYYSDHDCYPAFPLKDAQLRPSYACGSDILKPYLDSMPCDPNTKTPYTIYVTPIGSTCPQQFAVYAQIYSFFDSQANNIDYCPKTIAFSSPGMLNTDIIFGCSFQEVCKVLYGCVDYACVVVAEDGKSPCRYDWCESDCNGNCNRANRQCY